MDEFETSDRAPLVPNAQENGLETVLVVQDEGERRTEEQRTGTSTVETETICRIACTEHLNSNRNAVERVLPLSSPATEFTSNRVSGNTPFSVLPLSTAAKEFKSEELVEKTASSVETETRLRRACAEHLNRTGNTAERVLPLSSAMESTGDRVAGNTLFSKEFTSEELVEETGTSSVETETRLRKACAEHLNSSRNAVERVLPLSSVAKEFAREQLVEETASSSVETETRLRKACAEHLNSSRNAVEKVLPLSSAATEFTSGRVAGNTPSSKEFTSEELVEETGTSSVETETICRRACAEHLNSNRNAVERVLPLSSATTEFTSERISGYAPYLRSPEEGRHSWPMPWMSMPPSLLADQPSIQAPSFVPVQAEVAIDSKADSYVRTDDLEEAFDVLEDKGRVVLCAPPGAGKTAVAHALLRRCRDEGFEPCVFTDIKDWQTHVAEGKRTAVLLDGTLGEVRVDPEQYRQWRSLLGSILPLTSQGDCRLVVTLYPHILKELEETEDDFSSPLLDKLSVVRLLRKDLKNETKKKMLQFHLKNLEIAPSLQEELMEAVLAKDVSGPVFPWCCCYLAEHWHLTQDSELGFAKNYAHSKSPNHPDISNPNSKSQNPPYIPGPNSKSQNPPDILYPSSKSKTSADIPAIWQADDIFTHPEEAYIPLLKRMLRHGSHGKTFAAVLALTMKGLGGFLHDDERVEPHLGQLRFERFSEYHLSEYADVLKGFILSADGDYGFASRVLYDAAGLALGRAFSLPVLLQVCDDRFLVKYVRAFKNSPLDPFTVYTGAEPKVRDLFMERVYDGVLHGNHAELCQHPELCSADFQKEFEAFCSRRKKNLQQWVASLDGQHAMTLLYWSTWSSTDQLTRWCLDIIYRTYFFRKKPTESLLCSALMCVIFTQPASLARDRAKPFAEELLKVMAKVTKAEELLGDDTPVIIEFPYPAGELLTAAAKHKERVLLERAKNPSATPFAPDIITPVVVSADDKTVSVKMTKCAWCWTVLSAAQGRVGGPKTEDTGTQELDPRLVARFLQGSGATGRIGPAFMREMTGSLVGTHATRARTLSVGEIVGYTPRDLHNAIKRGDLADVTAYLCVYKCATLDDRLSNSCTPLHSAAGSGQHEIADFLLRLGADVNAQMFTHSDTPLHVACGAGDERMATVLLQFGADVNVAGFGGYFPIHRACALGHQGIVELLLTEEADVNTRTLCGERTTPLHVACFHGHVDLIKCLLRHGANIKAKNGDGRTPLDVARKKGMSEVVDLMLAVLGDDLSSTPDRVSVVL